jgi:RNA polymerase sigma-70 factor (ECF subfamily)
MRLSPEGCCLSNEAALGVPLHAPNAAQTPGAVSGQSPPAPADVVTAARDGDRAAFAELYRTHVRMVHGVLLARVPRIDVDDLVQEVFLTAIRKLPSLRDPRAFPGWLASIARNRASDYFRRRGTETVELPENLAAAGDDGHAALAVLGVVRSLPEAYRETLTLRLVEGMTGPEIAARTGLTEGSVRVNLHRGMKLLRARLDGRAEP